MHNIGRSRHLLYAFALSLSLCVSFVKTPDENEPERPRDAARGLQFTLVNFSFVVRAERVFLSLQSGEFRTSLVLAGL